MNHYISETALSLFARPDHVPLSCVTSQGVPLLGCAPAWSR